MAFAENRMSESPIDLAPEAAAERPAPRPDQFLGVRFERMTRAEIVTAILTRAPDARLAAVVTPNADHVARISRSKGAIQRAYENAWLCVNDSRVIEFMARAKGVPLKATAGADIVVDLFDDPRLDRSAPVMLVGGDEALFQAFVARTGLTDARHYAAPPALLADRSAFDATIAHIEANPSRLVLLGVGSPQQELIAEELRSRGTATGVALCIGAAVEFMVGRRRRAPKVFSRLGLEWLFRLLSEPRRLWRRYLVDSPRIFVLYLREPRR